jgi:hypothetical protein
MLAKPKMLSPERALGAAVWLKYKESSSAKVEK